MFNINMKKILLTSRFNSILYVSILFTLLSCVNRVPVNVESSHNVQQYSELSNKYPVTVGLFVEDDTADYSYKKKNDNNMTVIMETGRFVRSTSKEILQKMFKDVVNVESLPPYNDNYRPGVDLVIKTEIVNCYGDAIGLFSGYFFGNITLQISMYDLAGNVVWQRVENSSKRKEVANLVANIIGGIVDISAVAYEALYEATVKVAKTFNAAPPEKLLSVIEMKNDSDSTFEANNPNQFWTYFDRGKSNFLKKNYDAALHYFKKSYKYSSKNTPDTDFLVGSCYAYMGEKSNAIVHFNNVLKGAKTKETVLAKEWIKRLERRLSVAIAFETNTGNSLDILTFKDSTTRWLQAGKLYNVSSLKNYPEHGSVGSNKFDAFMTERAEIGDEAVVYLSNEVKIYPAMLGKVEGDVANKIEIKILATIYSVKTKKMIGSTEVIGQNIVISKDSSMATQYVLDRLSKMLTPKLVQAGLI
jgi:tetratricopeptide (TPR) repeat protein